MLRLSKAALAAAAVCAFGTAAGAVTPVFIQTAGIYNPGVVSLSGAKTGNDYVSSVLFHANVGTGAAGPGFDLTGFCVDLFHNITVGFGGQTAVNLNYHLAPLLTDSNGNLLSVSQKQQIGGLASLGFTIQQGNAADKYANLAAIQGAIWSIEYPDIQFAGNGGYSDLTQRIASYVAQAPLLHGTARTIYADNLATQGFIVGGAVPEPTSWALLIAGFGMVGVAARRRRMATTVVAA